MNTMTPTPPPNEEEHNPDSLSPAQYGAPEWRLLRVGEETRYGDAGAAAMRDALTELETLFEDKVDINNSGAPNDATKAMHIIFAALATTAGESLLNEIQSLRCDSHALGQLIDELAKANPDHKGCPAPTDWAMSAVRSMVDERESLLARLMAAEKERDEARRISEAFAKAHKLTCDSWNETITERDTALAKVKELEAKLAIKGEWRMLKEGDRLQDGDEYKRGRKWVPVEPEYFNDPVCLARAFRRKTPPAAADSQGTEGKV